MKTPQLDLPKLDLPTVTRTDRMMFFDIEATSLNASFGHLLCMGYAFNNEAPVVARLQDFKTPKTNEEPDKYLCEFLHALITNKADVLVSYYGKEYDRKFLNTRMALAGLPPMPPLNAEHIDLYYTVRGNLRLHSNRLQAVSETLGCPVSKTPVRADTWVHAMRGDKAAIEYVVDHCAKDVEILRWCYYKLRPFIRQHPRTSIDLGLCRVCGLSSWERRGRKFRAGAEHQSLRCKKCGHWAYQNVATGKFSDG